jgi:hypothetical protein
MTTELQTLALEIAHDISRSDIECFCTWINDDDGGARVWFDLDSANSDETERELVARAERFLELAARLERRADNPRIVRIKAIGAAA